jgi:hypothetical protein
MRDLELTDKERLVLANQQGRAQWALSIAPYVTEAGIRSM